MKQELLKKEYSWESIIDVEEDIEWAIQERLPGEFKGTIRVTVEYLEEEDE